MRLTAGILASIAALAAGATGCADKSSDSGCGSLPPDKVVAISTAEACVHEAVRVGLADGGLCPADCSAHLTCTMDPAYERAFVNANPDTGKPDAGPVTCPTTVDSQTTVTCISSCTGRRTAGIPEPVVAGRSLGEWLAANAYLEAASVLAFARLRTELEAHGAPADLLARVDLARREEERHTEMTSALARSHGATPSLPSPATLDAGVRGLAEIARENAVEGCIRETWGATLAFYQAEHARDPELRAALATIARDEGAHAALAWDIDAWIRSRLDAPAVAQLDLVLHQATAILGRDAPPDLERGAAADAGLPSPAARCTLIEALGTHVFRAALLAA